MSVKKVLIVGPSITRTKGGMATVINDMLENKQNDDVEFTHLISHAEGHAIEKILLTIKTFFKVLTRVNYDLIHIHVASGASFFRKSLAVWAGSLRRKPVIMHVHGADFDTFYHHSFSFIKYYIRRTFSACSKVLVLSGYWKEFFVAHIYAGNIEVLHNGVYTEVFRQCNTTPANLSKFLFLGRLGQRKGVYDLLEVIDRLVNIQQQKDLVFYLAGDGELEQVKKIIQKNNLQNHVQLLGWLNEQEKMKWLKQADTIILPSYNEGLPMAILEAMAGGKVIISSKVGGIPDLVKEGENGFLIQPGDAESLCRYILYVKTHPAEMQQISANNINKIEACYNLKKINNRLADIYREISS